MFSYYGSKRLLAHLYPEPAHDLIIEPFAGSASYSLHGDRWQREVVLLERDDRIAEVWRWLVEEATPASVLRLPDLRVGESSSDFLAIISVATQGANLLDAIDVTPELAYAWERSRSAMATNVIKVKHWQVRCTEFWNGPDIEATWFVDPPYQGAVGDGYVFGSSSLDFVFLAEWLLARSGQVVACESGCADYLPFVPLRPGLDTPDDPHAEFLWHRPSARQSSVPPGPGDQSPPRSGTPACGQRLATRPNG